MIQKIIKISVAFLVCWIAVFNLLGYTSSNDMGGREKLAISGIISLIVLIGVWFKLGETDKKTSKKKSYNTETTNEKASGDIYIFEGDFGRKLIYRIQNNKIYEGLGNKYNYEIKDGKIYKALSSQWIYRIEGNRVYKGLDKKVVYRVENNKVYEGDFGRVPRYRISSSING